MNGLFIVDKEEGMTSRDVVDEIIRKTETRKVGHTGTLDPIATGVLLVCVGKATKFVSYLTAKEKEYEAKVCLGVETDTLDRTGTIMKEEKVSLTEAEIDAVLASMIGKQEQEVPIYSAKRVNGKKLYEYAREHQEVELPKREIEVFELNRISPIEEREGHLFFTIRAKVSKGTYIRGLIRDIANSLHTVGSMEELRRTKQGSFSIEEATPISQLRLKDLYPISKIVEKIPSVVCDERLKKEILNGKILKNIYHQEMIVFKDEDGLLLAVYQIYEKDNDYIKPYVMLGGVE